MGNRMHPYLAGVVMLLGVAGTSHAANIDGDVKARQGVVRCGGNNFQRAMNNSEVHFMSYSLRNLSSATPITIERLTFFDATGAILFDSGVSGIPVFANGILGAGDAVLDPNQTAQLDTIGMLPNLPIPQRPIQLEISWSAPERVLTLQVSEARIVRERDPISGAQLAERSRTSGSCRTISLQGR